MTTDKIKITTDGPPRGDVTLAGEEDGKMMMTNSTVLVTGNTYPVKDSLKAMGARWDAAAKGWRVPAAKAAAAQALVPGVKSSSAPARRWRAMRSGGLGMSEASVKREWVVLQLGIEVTRFASEGEAQAFASSANAEMLEECGQDLGDGACCVIQCEEDGGR